jgi:hypothetical protein
MNEPPTTTAQLRMNLRTRLPSCIVDWNDLIGLFRDLEPRLLETADREIATIAASPRYTTEALNALKVGIKEASRLTVVIEGRSGAQITGDSVEVLMGNNMPTDVARITFDSGDAYRKKFGSDPPNRVRIIFDFTEPPFNTYNPFAQPPSNTSVLQVVGVSDTWVNGVYQSVLAFLRTCSTDRSWLHSGATYDRLNWFAGIPATLWVTYRLDTILGPVGHAVPTALHIVAFLYVWLIAHLGFRTLVMWLRSVFPLVEFKGARSWRIRGVVGSIVLALVASIVYDVAKAIFH